MYSSGLLILNHFQNETLCLIGLLTNTIQCYYIWYVYFRGILKLFSLNLQCIRVFFVLFHLASSIFDFYLIFCIVTEWFCFLFVRK